jgi:hypothetical protein
MFDVDKSMKICYFVILQLIGIWKDSRAKK